VSIGIVLGGAYFVIFDLAHLRLSRPTLWLLFRVGAGLVGAFLLRSLRYPMSTIRRSNQ
jgi:hypothetical protein